MPVKVPKPVLDGLVAVRETGCINMLDRERVIELLYQLGCDDAAKWVECNKRTYALGIFQGFEAEP